MIDITGSKDLKALENMGVKGKTFVEKPKC